MVFPAIYNKKKPFNFCQVWSFYEIKGIKILTLKHSHTNSNKLQNTAIWFIIMPQLDEIS